MNDMFRNVLLPQLAAGAPHTAALGFILDGIEGGDVRLRTPWRADLVGDPDTGVLSGGLVTTMLDHVGGLATWVALDGYQSIATLDLRVDYMRAARPHVDLLAQAHCYRLTRNVAFVRAWAFEECVSDPVAASQAAYMLTSDGTHRIGVNLREPQKSREGSPAADRTASPERER